MKVGYLLSLKENGDLDQALAEVVSKGFDTIQLGFRDKRPLNDPAYRKEVRALLDKHGVTVTEVRARFYGPAIWDLKDGPATLGIVPEAYRANRINDILAWADFANEIGVKIISTHLGFVPVDCRHPDYTGTLLALRHICLALKKTGQQFLIETGQEHPVVLMRMFADIGEDIDNLFINYDPANLIMYGNANGADWVRIFGKYITEVHAKDGDYPADGYTLGEERNIGEGKVDFPRFIGELKAIGFDGVLCIENQRDTALHASHITPEEREQELVESKRYLESLINA